MKLVFPHFRILSSSAAALLAALVLAPAPGRAGTFDYVSGVYTETFDSLGTDGLSTSALTNDLPNSGSSPWTIGIPTGHTGVAPALMTGDFLQFVNDGNIAVTGGSAQMFNNGSFGDFDRALGTGNTVNDPLIDLAIRNSSTHGLIGFTISYDTEFWRGGGDSTTPDFGFSLFYSTTGAAGSWLAVGAPVPQLFTPASGILNGNDPVNRATTSVPILLPSQLAIGSSIFFRWFDTNDPTDGPDAIIALDNVQISELASLVYNRGHAVPGGPAAPNGRLEIGGGNYFLNGAAPTAFSDGAIVKFAQPGNANIEVPGNLTATIVAEHASGTYTLGGAGQISGSFTSAGTGEVALTNTNLFSVRTLGGGGRVSVQAFNALGSTGGLTVAAGGVTLDLAADNSLTGPLNGPGNLTITGAGTLSFNSVATGTSTGVINLTGGKLFASVPLALGGNSTGGQVINASNNAILEFSQTADTAFSPKILNVGTGGATISSTNFTTTQAITVTTADTFRGSAPITKAGTGVYRFSAAQPNLSSPWIINGGTLEMVTSATALGAGSITINAGGTFILSGTAALTLANNFTLNGGTVGTRSASLAVYGTAANTFNVTANSFVNLRSSTTPTGALSFTIASKLTGAGGLNLTGPIPSLATVNGALILTNPTNTYSGHFSLNSLQQLTSTPAGGTGSALGTSTIALHGAILNVNDNGTANNGTIAYGNNLTVEAPTDFANPGFATINVNRQGTGAFTGNTIQFGTLSFGAQSLTVTGANDYGVAFGATTLTGPAILNTIGANVTMGPVLGGAETFSKSGTGNLTLIGASTYTGITASAGGALTVSGSLSGSVSVGSGALNVNGPIGGTATVGDGIINLANAIGGALTVSGVSSIAGIGSAGSLVVGSGTTTFNPGDAAHHGVLHFGDTTFGQTATDTVTINLNVDTVAANRGYLDVGNLTVASGTIVTVRLINDLPPVGFFPIVDYSGAELTPEIFNAFVLAPVTNPRITAVLNHNTNSKIVELNVQKADAPRWTGLGNAVWTSAVQANKNWQLVVSGLGTDYLAGEEVLFDNNATNKTVNLTAEDVSPGKLTFNNSGAGNNYTLTGTFGIAGGVTLTKTGSGALTIENTNTFTGPVEILGGTVNVASISDANTPGTLGAGPAVNLNGGTLNYTGPALATTRGLNLTGPGTLAQNGSGDLTLSGNLTGTGVLTKTGPGKLILTGTGSNVGGVTVAQGVMVVGEGAGSPGAGPLVNQGELIFDHAGIVTVLNAISGSGPINKINFGTTTFGGTSSNTNTGLVTVAGGTLFAGKTAGVNAIGGDLLIQAGATFRYLGDNIPNQIADTATVTVDGGTFGDPFNAAPLNPSYTDTIANLVLKNNGSFGSGRNMVGLSPFMVTGATTVNGSLLQAQRAGGFITNSLLLENGSTLKFDGGSTTAASESRVNVGSGGLTIRDSHIMLNAGPGGVGNTALGSVLTLNGNVVSSGFNEITRAGDPAAKALVDLGGGNRTFDVTDTLTIGIVSAPINLTNGGIIKDGPGSLVLGGVNDYTGPTAIRAGTLSLTGSISGSSNIDVQTAGTLDVTAVFGFAIASNKGLSGSGNILGDVQINGTVAPGAPGAVPNLGNLTFANALVLGPTSTSNFELVKTGNTPNADQITLATATAITLGGTLHVTLSGSPVVPNDTFTLFESDILLGEFATLDLPALPNGFTWDTTDLTMDGTITVVPEPAGCALLLGGLSLLASRRRRTA